MLVSLRISTQKVNRDFNLNCFCQFGQDINLNDIESTGLIIHFRFCLILYFIAFSPQIKTLTLLIYLVVFHNCVAIVFQ